MIKLHDKHFKPYISAQQIDAAVQKIALEIAEDFKDEVPIFVCVLNGAFMFASDLLKHYPYPCEISFVKLSSYKGLSSTGIVKTLLDVSPKVTGRSVVIIEDIIDTGRTLKELIHMFSDSNVKEFKVASMFYKESVYSGEYNIDYVGMKIPNDFIVGYGLDYNELGRNLPEVYKINTNKNMINLVIFGKPGAGKGTQAAFLKEEYNLVHISTGDVFRYNIKNQTDLGKLAKSYMDKGDLVPDEVTIDMLRAEVEKNTDAAGFIFDGFPRTEAQANALDVLLDAKDMNVSATIALEADDDILVKRLLERGKESGRPDDQDEEKIRNRFDEYNKKTAPLMNYYRSQGKFHSVNGVGTIEDITKKLRAIIDQL
ncbi:adenylate kinase [Flavobacteriaceae bacterium M23B6Z8]